MHFLLSSVNQTCITILLVRTVGGLAVHMPSWILGEYHNKACDTTGDDAFDVVLDTDEILENPVLGPIAREVLARVAGPVDPREALFPITRIPGTPFPSLVPVPRPNRLYFRCLFLVLPLQE